MLAVGQHVPEWLAMQFKQTRRYGSFSYQQLGERAPLPRDVSVLKA
jgi:hypothetical protein